MAAALVPYHDRDGFIWYDGKLVPWREATLHVLTHGLHYASAVFEGERAYGGRIFKLREHTERLIESAQMLDFEIPYTADQIDAACNEVMQANNLVDCYVRPIAWRGSEQMGVSAQLNKIHLVVAAWDWGSYFDPKERLRGIRIALAQYRRPDPATIPAKAKATGLYMICTIEKHRAEKAGYADALMYDWRGRVAECTGANIFFVKDGALHTPYPRLLPRRHHAPHGHGAGQAPRHRGARAHHHAGRAAELHGVLHRRHSRRGDARARDRTLQLSARPDLGVAAERLHGSRAAGQKGGGIAEHGQG